MYRILFVDDDQDLQLLNRTYFQHQGYQVLQADCTEQTLSVVGEQQIDCIVLDISLPEESGFDICRKVKEVGDIPIIFLSSHTEEASRVNGFLTGGDDYMTKPYSLQELELRVKARIRQYQDGALQELRFPPIRICENSRTVRLDEEETAIALTAAEFNILAFLAKHAGQVFSTADIYEKVWNQPDLGDAHTVQVHLASVRKKLNSLREEHKYIETVWGKGYKFNP